MAAVSTFSLLILHYFTSDYLHMLEECVNLISAARCRNYCNNQYKKLRCLFTNGTWEKDTRLCNNYALSHEYFVDVCVQYLLVITCDGR